MKPRLSRFLAVALALALFAIPQMVQAQTVSLFPDEVPNGIQAASSKQYHQRFNVTITGTPTAQTVALTITLPPELTVVANSATAAGDATGIDPTINSASGSTVVLGIRNGSALAAGDVVSIEFDVTTPTNFTGISNGAKVDTSYTFDFAPATNLTDANVPVAKHQNRPIRTVSFASPDSSMGDTTTAGGRFYKLEFPSALPDPSHRGTSGLTGNIGPASFLADAATDVLYSFYLSTDSSMVERSLDLNPVSFYTLRSEGDGPLLGTRQSPRFIPNTFIREAFTTDFSSVAADSVNGMISLSGTMDNTVYYVYVLADPAPTRTPSTMTNTIGSTKKDYDPFTLGAFSGGVFLGRSGPLRIEHAPDFVLVGWDWDNDTNDSFDNTGVIQVASDMINLDASAESKDNRDITVDTGSLFNKGTALAGFESGNVPAPVATVDLLFLPQDANDPGDFQMNIFLSTQSGLSEGDFESASPSIDSLTGAIKLAGTDTLTINHRNFTFNPIVRDSVTNLITSFVPEADYFVYFAATDGEHRTIRGVQEDPFVTSPSFATLSVRHAPTMTSDTFSLNDFDGSSDGDLDVVTGIDVSQMTNDVDGKDLIFGPAQRYVTISWGGQGLDGDQDVDDNATIEFYYSTRSDFRDSRGSVAYTSGNSDGSDLKAAITQGNNDTHRIGAASEDPDGQFDNQFIWDLWTYVSPEGTIPRTHARYYIYALLTGGSTERLFSLTLLDPSAGAANTTQMAVSFQHPPYISPNEPSRDISVTVDEPVLISWEAFDVDNEEGVGTPVPAGTSGRIEPNNRTSSPNIRILLTTADFGEVTTWGSLTNASAAAGNTDHNSLPIWLGNSNNGQLLGEVELNEGVDTSFVIVGNRLRDNIAGNGLTSANGALALQTNSGIGETYFVYLTVDRGGDGTVADAVTTSPQATNFDARSVAVRAPGRITFTGTVPANPPTSNRFAVADKMETTVNEIIRYPIIPDVSVSGTQINVIDIFITVDPSRFEAVDTDAGRPGIQPFTLGDNSAISASNVNQSAYTQGGQLRLDFIYSDVTNGLTFFDGIQPLAYANLRAKALTGSTVSTTISVDNTTGRVSKMLDSNNIDISAQVPSATEVTINRRATVSGKVPLQGRSSSADTVTFMLREVGSFTTLSDSLFQLNDINTGQFGIQIQTTDIDGKFSLSNVPAGVYVLSAAVPRHLTGHDTLVVKPGLDVSNVQPTRDGSGVQHASLKAGDAAGYTDSTGASVPDNSIGNPDINAVNDALFTQPGDADYNTFADINRDNIVNATDKDFATGNTTSNTGAAGNVRPVFPSFKAALPEGKNSDAVVTLAGLPDREVRAGETFDVTIEVSGARAVRTYEVHLSYDPKMLAVDDIVSTGSLLENYLTDMSGKILDNGFGLANSVIGRTPVGASGEGTLATVRFRAISRAAETKLGLSEAMLIDVAHANATPQLDGEALIVLSKDPIVYHDADGNEIRGLILADQDATVDFNDFVTLVKAFGTSAASADYDLRADLNGDDQVDFADFIVFSQDFGRTAVDAPASGRLSKVATESGANTQAQVSLKVDGAARMGQDLVVVADLSQVATLQGWGLTVQFDSDQFEFVEAKASEGNLLSAQGGEAPLFLVKADGDQVSLANALASGEMASGEGSVALLVFRPKGEFENARFEIANGVVFDANNLSNPLFTSSALEVQLTPAEFALNQNYPNPFNPETTISYDLADGSKVRLEVYNVMGQLVQTLVSQDQPAGRYRVVWNGADAAHRQVASGVYFYRLQTKQFSAVKKLMLLK